MSERGNTKRELDLLWKQRFQRDGQGVPIVHAPAPANPPRRLRRAMERKQRKGAR